MRRAAILAFIGISIAFLSPLRARAQEQQKATTNAGAGTPVLVDADELQYDQDLGVIVAKGHVELSQKDQILLADTVTYNQRTDTVTASGNVSIMQPTGDVAFADYMELHNDMRDGFIKDVRLLLSDRSRLAGNTARRAAGTRTEVRRAIYSPCELCAQDPTHPPTWQIKAEQAVDDKQLQIIEYRDAIMEIDGFPIFYTPYMSHPEPSVKRASGFLAPTIGSDPSNGFRVGIPYYWVIGPDKDATIRPLFTTEGGEQLNVQYRQRFGNGTLRTDSSVTVGSTSVNPRLVDVNAANNSVRGHFIVDGIWDLNDRWRTGISAEGTSDQTYLARYHFPYTSNYVTQHVYAENFGTASYGNISAYGFQNLNPTYSIANQPVVLPIASYTLTTPADALGGRWDISGSALNLMGRNGFKERRLSAGTNWRLPFYGPLGDRYDFNASLRADEYDSDFTVAAGYPQNTTAIAARIFPQMSLNWRYPWIRPGEKVTALIEPIASAVAAPNGGNPASIPNEDAQSFEFDETDLFQANRFPGYDRVDGGIRVDYGIHAGLYNPTAGNAQILIGQSYRVRRESAFPLGAGLDNRRSDVVGRVIVSPGRLFNFFYRARVDGQDLAMRRQEVGLSGGLASLNGGVSFITASAIPGIPSVLPTKEISESLSFSLSPNWKGTVSNTQNLANGSSSVSSRLQLTYLDDCLSVTGTISQSGITFGDVRSGESFVLTFVFRNLGDVSISPF